MFVRKLAKFKQILLVIVNYFRETFIPFKFKIVKLSIRVPHMDNFVYKNVINSAMIFHRSGCWNNQPNWQESMEGLQDISGSC